MKTKLMSKLFSQDCSSEYREKILAKVDEAHENGSATLEEDGEVLQFAEVGDDIIIEDQSAEPIEVTKLSANPDDENDLIATAVEIDEPTEEVSKSETEEVEETRVESDVDSKLVSSIEISRIPGPDGKADDIVDDLEIKVDEGIESKEKSGTFSIRFKNVSEKYAKAFTKVFSAMESELDKIVESAEVDEDVEVKFEGEEKMKVMSIVVKKSAPTRTFSDGSEEVEESTKQEEEQDKKEFEEGFKEGEEFQEGKDEEKTYEEEKTESESEAAPEESDELDVTSVLDSANELVELVGDGVTKENAPEVKEKAEQILIQAEKLESNGAKMGALKAMCNKYSEECAACMDAEEVPAETEEVIVEEEKGFSDPKVTVTIENLEPASVSSLLKPAGYEAGEEPKSELEPAVDPNKEEVGRTFSVTNTSKSINPFLKTEIK